LQGDPAGALKDYDTVIRLNPNDADAFSKRGLLRLKQGDSVGAQKDLNLARQLGEKP
jgi:Flp pilus assembly protein TadD